MQNLTYLMTAEHHPIIKCDPHSDTLHIKSLPQQESLITGIISISINSFKPLTQSLIYLC